MWSSLNYTYYLSIIGKKVASSKWWASFVLNALGYFNINPRQHIERKKDDIILRCSQNSSTCTLCLSCDIFAFSSTESRALAWTFPNLGLHLLGYYMFNQMFALFQLLECTFSYVLYLPTLRNLFIFVFTRQKGKRLFHELEPVIPTKDKKWWGEKLCSQWVQ